jgi:hypothetical protein
MDLERSIGIIILDEEGKILFKDALKTSDFRVSEAIKEAKNLMELARLR